MMPRGIAAAVLASLAVGASVGAAVAAAAPRFSAPVLRVTGISTWGLVAADVDGDGNLDLATVNDAGRVAVVRGRGDGSFGRRAIYRISSGDPGDINAADLSGDGRPDLVTIVSPYSDVGWVDVLLNDGAGRFRRDRRYEIESAINELAAADVNTDGVVDLVLTHDTGLSVLLGTGAGRFGASLRLAGPGAGDIAVGDLNGDGRLDLALRNFDRDGVALRLGNGDGTFGPERGFGLRDVRTLTLGDLNNDGKLDLAAGSDELDSGVSLFLGNGDGTLAAALALRMRFNPNTVVIADLDGDGNADIAATDDDRHRVVLRSGRGDGTFGPTQSVRWEYFGPLVVTDVNRDGRPDLASGGYAVGGAPGVSVLLNWTGLAAQPCVVVQVTRSRRSVANRDIKEAGCRLGRVRYRYSRTVRKNRVISQRPDYGAVLATNARVHLVVSRGRRS